MQQVRRLVVEGLQEHGRVPLLGHRPHEPPHVRRLSFLTVVTGALRMHLLKHKNTHTNMMLEPPDHLASIYTSPVL